MEIQTVCGIVDILLETLNKPIYDLHEVNINLDKLISITLNHKVLFPDRKNLAIAVTTCCSRIAVNNALLVAKACNFIYNVTFRQKINLDNQQLTVVVSWLVKALKTSADIAYLDLLQVTTVLIQNNPSFFSKESDELIDVLMISIEKKAMISNPVQVKIYRLNCLKALLPNAGKNKHIKMAKVFLESVFTMPTDELDNHAKVWSIAIESLDILCVKSQEWLAAHIVEVIGIIAAACSLGVDGGKPELPKMTYPSSVIVPPEVHLTSGEVKAKAKVTLHLKKMSKIKQVEWSNGRLGNDSNDLVQSNLEAYNTWWPQSESDQSDTEGGDSVRLVKLQARTRHAAFNLLIQIVKVIGCRPISGYFALLIGKLIYNIRRENLTKPKITALAAITALLTSSKPFLSQAQYREGGSFTTFSDSLSELLTNLHTILGQTLKSSSHNFSLIPPFLHTIAALISVTPYQRLRPSLLTNIFRVIQDYMFNKDPLICCGVLSCLLQIVILNPVIDEQTQILLLGVTAGENDPCWIFTFALNLIKDQKSNENVKTAAWQILSGLCQCHYSLIRNHINTLEEQIFKDLGEINDSKHQLHVAKTLDYLLSKLSSDEEMYGHRKELWMKLISGPFVPLAQSSTKIAALACEFLSNMGAQIFHTLSEDLQILVFTLIYGCSYNELSGVRAAAVNTLGMFLLFPQVIDDQFLYDTKDILVKALQDGNDLVRSKAAWAFGNLVELILNNPEKEFVKEMSVLHLLEAALLVMKDNQNVKGNILRAIGNLTLLISANNLAKNEYKEILNKSTEFCLSCATSGTLMKMRWNACYAIETMLKNEVLYSHQNNWLGNIINSLCSLILKCNNFKVRVSACKALCSITKREHYHIYYHHVWNSLLEGLDNAANMPDFKEFKHQDNLKQQLCLSICHMVMLLKEEDVGELAKLMDYRMETLKQNMIHFLNFAPPEKTSVVLLAANNISNLISLTTPSQKSFLNSFYKSFQIVCTVES